MQRPKEKEQKDKHRSTKHYTETKRQTQIYKTLHRDKKTNTDQQNTTPRQKDKHRSTKHYTETKRQHRSTKHYTETKRQTQIYKTLHWDKKTNTDLQNTTLKAVFDRLITITCT